jgi:hypothetical protein
MAIIDVKETFGNRTLAQDSKYQVTINRQFKVISDIINEYMNNVTQAEGIPTMYDPHPEFEKALMVGASAKQDSGEPRSWIVDCTYSTNPDSASASASGAGGGVDQSPEVASQQKGSEPANRIENPLNRPADIQISTGFQSYVLEKSFAPNARKVCNTAGEMFATPLMFRFPFLIINCSRNIASFNVSNLNYYVDRTNNASVTLFGGTTGIVQKTIQAGDLLVENISANRVLENNVSYWRVSMVLHVIVPDSWSNLPENASPGFDARLRNVGFNGFFSASSTALRPLVPGAKVPSDLDENGYKLGDVDPIYLKFNTHPRGDLSWINTFLSSGAF